MSIGKLSEFNVKTGLWSSYVERLDSYFKVNKVTDEFKLPTLIATMGDEAYELLVNLASPKKPSDLTFGEADSLMRQHLQPTPSILAERYRFRQKRQGEGEDVAVYVAELKRLARNCKFAANLNENLRDQFVCGLRSDVTRQRLFAEDDSVTFLQAVKLASSLEAAERDAAFVDKTSTGEPSAVHALMSSGGRGGRGGRSRGRGAGTATAAGRGPSVPRSSGAKYPNCAACGATNHSYASCRYREFNCSKCQKTGHLRRVCPENDGRSTSRGGPNFRRGGQKDSLYFGDARVNEEDSSEDVEENLNLIGLDNYKAI